MARIRNNCKKCGNEIFNKKKNAIYCKDCVKIIEGEHKIKLKEHSLLVYRLKKNPLISTIGIIKGGKK